MSRSQGVPARSLNEKARGVFIWPELEVSDRTKRKEELPLMQILVALILVGILLWLVNRFIPMQSNIKSILNGVVVIAVVLWLLNAFGLFHSLARIHRG